MRHVRAAILAVLLGLVCLSGWGSVPAEPPQGGTDAARVDVIGMTLFHTDAETGRSLVSLKDAGTTLYLRIRLDGRRILQVLPDDSERIGFRDDRGNDLPPRAGFREREDWVGAGIEVSGGAAVLPIVSAALPGPSARAIELHARIAMVTAGERRTAAQTGVLLTAGTRLTVGLPGITIDRVEPTEDERYTRKVTFARRSKFHGLVGVRFLDADGEIVASRFSDSSRRDSGEGTVFTRTYAVAGDAERLTVEMTWHKDVRRVDVPVDLTIGVGLDRPDRQGRPRGRLVRTEMVADPVDHKE